MPSGWHRWLAQQCHPARWIDEVVRVVRPSGIAIFTNHGDTCLDRLLPDEQQAYRAGKVVVRGGVSEGSKCFVAYHPPAYVREQLLRDADVVAHLSSPASYQMVQDVWVARKRMNSEYGAPGPI